MERSENPYCITTMVISDIECRLRALPMMVSGISQKGNSAKYLCKYLLMVITRQHQKEVTSKSLLYCEMYSYLAPYAAFPFQKDILGYIHQKCCMEPKRKLHNLLLSCKIKLQLVSENVNTTKVKAFEVILIYIISYIL